MLCPILYLENSDKSSFPNLKKHAEDDYVLNKAEYPSTVTAEKSLLLNYQPNYNSNRNYQYNEVSNQLMFAQRGKTEDDKGNGKEKEQRPRINLDHITCNDCGEKVRSAGKSDCPNQAKLKEDAEAFRNMKQEKSFNPPLVEDTRKHW